MEIRKIDLSRQWIDDDWELFATNSDTLSKTDIKGKCVFEIVNNSVIIGLIQFDVYDADRVCYIAAFEIKKNYRNNGYGTCAIKKLLLLMNKCKDIDRIELNPTNRRSQQFWARCGFKSLGVGDGTMFINN